MHNQLILLPLVQAFELADWDTDTEAPVRVEESIAFVDLLAQREGYCIAVEVECSAARIERDLEKAQALRADELWIVTPNVAVANQVRRKLARLFVRCDGSGLFVLTQGAALERVRNCLPFFAAA